MIGPLLIFIRSPLGKYAIAALAVILILLGVRHMGYSAGVKHEQAAYAKALEKAEKKAAETKTKSDTITAKAEEQHVQTVEKIRTVTKTLIQEVPYAVPSYPTRASLSIGFVRLHDAAATGLPGLSDPAGRPDAEASGIDDAALSRAVIANYETCRINSEAVTAWQSWVTDQAALYNAAIGAKR